MAEDSHEAGARRLARGVAGFTVHQFAGAGGADFCFAGLIPASSLVTASARFMPC